MYRLTIVSVLVALGLASNAMMQQADKNAFSEIFKHFSEESEFGAQLFLQLQSKVETGAPLSELDDHIAELKSHLEADHEADKKLFTSQEGHLTSQISGVEAQLEELEKQQQFLQGKIDVLNEQSQLIDDLFTSDHDAYTERISAQNAMIETIEQLTEKINQHLLEGHSLVQTDDLFEELKQLGRGKHIEVLAQLTAHLDKDQVDKIIFLFADLKKAITESLNADEEKEQENIKLHSSLREELGVLIPQTLQQYQELTVVLEAQQKEYAEAKQEILDLGQTYQDRADTRYYFKIIEETLLLKKHKKHKNYQMKIQIKLLDGLKKKEKQKLKRINEKIIFLTWIIKIMNNLLKPLDPIVTKLGLDQLDTLEILKGPCSKVGIRPAYAVSIVLALSIFSIIIGVASGFLSSLISMIYPAYASIKAIESTTTQDDKMWLTYWIVFSFFTVLDSSFGFLLTFIPFYHLIKLVFFVILFHPAVRGAEQIYQMLIHPLYEKYHQKIDSKLQDIQNQAKEKLNKQMQ